MLCLKLTGKKPLKTNTKEAIKNEETILKTWPRITTINDSKAAQYCGFFLKRIVQVPEKLSFL